MSILDLLQLNQAQLQAATAPGDLVVTAGAGSGKTRTLVARYLSLVERDVPLRAIVAITFTVKAAREMRNRIRRTITRWLAQDPPQRARWEAAFVELDAAHIGTIHSLCAHILRQHPVEAAGLGHMPGFGVLEEGRAAVLRARAVEEALAWAAEDQAASHLFGGLEEIGLRTAVATLLKQRLDADAAFARLADDPLQGWAEMMRDWLGQHLNAPQWQALLFTLSDLQADEAPTDKMEVARREVLAHAAAANQALAGGDVAATLAALKALRAATSLHGRKANWPGDDLAAAKQAMRDLRDYFDRHLSPLANPRQGASWDLDARASRLMWPLHATYRRALASYTQARRAENALDFDDLESGALALLEQPHVRDAWQANVHAVLVDEFQDTNERQRQIVYAVSGFEQRRGNGPARPQGSLFVVGDAKQSIYRFRGADVTVFRRVQDDVERAGGCVIPLDLTFRAHRPLVETGNRFLAPALDEVARPGHPYAVPFAPLEAHRAQPRSGIAPPFVEFHLGLGESASQGRQAAAEGLAARLMELEKREQVAWQDVALLFRASTAFPVYEDALEQASIPFVTVAGRGFYERYEVRDLLNGLTAVADPSDDLALVGLLRSPAIGLTDAALYMLRFPPPEIVGREAHAPYAIWAALNHPALPDIVPPGDVARALRARDLIADLHHLAGRIPVAALLKHLLDRTGLGSLYRGEVGSARARRNVNKLLTDAHASSLVSVCDFLEYVRTLRDVGVRESEAPAEAGGAVQLMTVHKAKGLEFPVVVIADAGHTRYGDRATVRLDERLGPTINLRDPDDAGRPAAYRLAAVRDAERDEAEARRLLYVAVTRTEEKLLVSGHAKVLRDGRLSLRGWLELLGRTAGLDEAAIAGMPVEPQELALAQDAGCTLYPWHEGSPSLPRPTVQASGPAPSISQDLVEPLTAPPSGLAAQETGPPRRVWRVVPQGKRPHAPAWVVGTLVHAALRHWCFDDQALTPFLRPFALEMGVVDQAEAQAAILAARRILRRFRAHPLWEEMDAAQRWHEVPFSIADEGRIEHGMIDLLYRVGEQWRIAEFKTDRLRARADLPIHIQEAAYEEQVRRYARAVRLQAALDTQADLVFLNVGREVVVVPVSIPRGPHPHSPPPQGPA